MSKFIVVRRALFEHGKLSQSIKSLSQAAEILAAGVGHNTYASFKQRDAALFEQAQVVLLDLERMVRRAADIGLKWTLDAARIFVHEQSYAVDEHWLTTSEGQDGPHRVAKQLLLSVAPAQIEFVVGGDISDLIAEDVQWASLASSSTSHGFVRGQCSAYIGEAEYKVALQAQVRLTQLTEHLIGHATLEDLGVVGDMQYIGDIPSDFAFDGGHDFD